MAKIVKLSEKASQIIDELAEQLNVSKQKIIENALKSYEKEVFFKKLSADYVELKKDSKAWKEYQDEISQWDVTLKDDFRL